MIMKKSILTVLFALICTMGFSQVSFNVPKIRKQSQWQSQLQ